MIDPGGAYEWSRGEEFSIGVVDEIVHAVAVARQTFSSVKHCATRMPVQKLNQHDLNRECRAATMWPLRS